MCRGLDNQEVGPEAATLERVRNSSLVESRRADNPTGLSPPPRPRIVRDGDVRTMVGERPRLPEKREREHAWRGGECECRYE